MILVYTILLVVSIWSIFELENYVKSSKSGEMTKKKIILMGVIIVAISIVGSISMMNIIPSLHEILNPNLIENFDYVDPIVKVLVLS